MNSGFASPALISTVELAARWGDPQLVILDATYAMPGSERSAEALFRASHIPGAQFFDIDRIADPATVLPHMLPPAASFEQHARALGIGRESRVVVYDRVGLMSAGRAWWTLRVFGHEDVAVLDGGLRKWLAEARPVAREEASSATRGDFAARPRPELVRSKAEMLANLRSGGEQVLDARSAARFAGTEGEPRPGLRAGHIPHSRNLPFSSLTSADTGELLPPDVLAGLFHDAGIDISRPVVTTCGTGVTAGALAFALHLISAPAVAVYDGSWAEWGLPGNTPVAR